MIVDFAEAAREELREAMEWYERRQEGLGDRFSNEVAKTIERIIVIPAAWAYLSRDVRCCPVISFPYSVLYRYRDNRIVVVAIMHQRRRPGYWEDRLDQDAE